jgi:mono/diheme cytochrome c family protein
VRRTATLLGGIAVLALLLTPTTGTAPRRRGAALAAQQQPADSPALEARGRELYQNACASCHGPDPAGASYYPTVPSLKDVGGAAAVNWALRTGRMPWKDNKGPAIERGEPRFSEEDIRALTVLHRQGGRRRPDPRRRPGPRRPAARAASCTARPAPPATA